MAYPPDLSPLFTGGDRINTTPQVNTHPTDHNTIHDALNDIVNVLGNTPQGDQANLTSLLQILCPLGEIRMWGALSAPSGWFFCTGAPISRTTYADLFAVIGTNFGVGDGSTTFNLPNLVGRVPVGHYAGGPFANVFGSTIGTADTFTVQHSHHLDFRTDRTNVDHQHYGTTILDGAHDHNLGDGSQLWWNSTGLPYGPVPTGGAGFDLATWDGAGSHAKHTHDFLTQGADRSLDHDHRVLGDTQNAAPGVTGQLANIQPSTVVNFIIRAAT